MGYQDRRGGRWWAADSVSHQEGRWDQEDHLLRLQNPQQRQHPELRPASIDESGV